MATEVITKNDLEEFRLKLLSDIEQFIRPPEQTLSTKPFLKNADVRKLLNISSNTLQRLRITGRLQSTKVGGTHFYRYADIQSLINAKR
jgi:Helix-turn-helix domain